MSCVRGFFDRNLTATSALNCAKVCCTHLNASAVWVDVSESAFYCRDRDDDKFIETALKAQAQYLVSCDNDLLEAAPLPTLQIISAQQALTVLGIQG